jgi:signal transduction histidine kinase
MIAASLTLYLIVAGVAREQIDQRLDTEIDGLRNALTAKADGTIALNASLDGPPFDRRGSGWYWQISGDAIHLTSRSLAGNNITTPPHPFDWRRLLTGASQPADSSDLHGEKLYLRSVEITVGNKAVEITVTAPQSALSGPAQRALFWLMPAMALLGAILLAGIFLQVRYGLRPLRKLTMDISSIAAGTLPRLPDPDVEELRPAIAEINRLVDQNLQRLAETRLHFANLAHGLKTPVTSLLLALSSANDPDGEMRALVGRIDHRIRHHLARARKTAAGGPLAATLVKPHVDDLVLIMSRIYAERAITVEYDIDPKLSIACVPEDVDEILGNLIDNSFKWARHTIKVTAVVNGGVVLITIEDDGAGMLETGIAEAFLPGVRMDETVPGDGFGLAIARELAELYGGMIALQNGKDAGLVCSISLPRTTDPAPVGGKAHIA